MASKPLSRTAPAPSDAQARVRDLTERRDALDRRRSAILAEGDELRKALDRAAERGEDAASIAADLVAVDARAQAVALEAQAVGRVLAAATAELAAEREAARIAGLEATLRERDTSFRAAEGRFRAALRSLSDAVGPAMAAHRAVEEACSALRRTPPLFDPSTSDEDLLGTLKATTAGVEFLSLAVPWVAVSVPGQDAI